MKPCSDIQGRILPLLRGDLPADQTEEMRRHLRQCPACRTQADDFRLVFEQTARDADREAPADLWPRIQRELVRRRSEISPTAGWTILLLRRAGAVAAAAALILALAWLAWNRIGSGSSRALAAPEFSLPAVALRPIHPLGEPQENDIDWREDVDNTQALAEYACIPVLYEVYFEFCPLSRRMNTTTLKNDKVIAETTRSYLCLRRQFEKDPKEVNFVGSPTFVVFSPEGDVLISFGGVMNAKGFLRKLDAGAGKYATRETFQKLRAELEKALTAYRTKNFAVAQKHLESFLRRIDRGAAASAAMKAEAETIAEAVRAYVAEKHAFARALVDNGEFDRARAFYRELLEEFEGLSVCAELQTELKRL